MNTIATFDRISTICSETVTGHYSTSFSWAIRLLHKDLRMHIHAIYGFVRLADEIVDTFHQFDKEALLDQLTQATREAVESRISLNPILHSFQITVNQFDIPLTLVEHFLRSMRMDLTKTEYTNHTELNAYIYGSAEVVGLMCLKVICEGNSTKYNQLAPAACKLGAAFQKINFLRDLEDDASQLKRQYFPGVSMQNLSDDKKRQLENDILADFKAAYTGIMQLPAKGRFGVYLAYQYYLALFNRIRKRSSAAMLEKRIRVHNIEKLAILLEAGIKHRFGFI
ncbi:Phytoene/squalene synthetase [Chitinophaga jiangningensis]|uniref:Phytoene/squalene synthetase n=1 Tax=Chitinophaga jiangningensis TaxID=1419482 RepID=A0A1M7A621_9BACT|nr:phytoene/squalene synthase family protein [Chitinophaga jiangningensis]SHL38115.1 Phytoene/squalene synthetase [Chitinophaga jiangningensis]